MAGNLDTLTRPVAEAPLRHEFGLLWRISFLAALGLVGILGLTLLVSLVVGVGAWGINVPFVWGFDLTNYAWWIGIANGSSLFAAILVLRRHSLRTAVNRFAEGTALMAAITAGLFPIVHLGRPWLFWWTLPYPATYEVWPQFRSTLTWDLWGILTHIAVTSLLWYVGLIPDLATLRDRARRPIVKRIYGFFALGWRGSVVHWAYHQRAYRSVAVLILPLILIMQSTVAFEFAVTLVPDWHETRQPLHFVATGLTQGLAVVLIVAALLRWGLRLGRIIDDADLNLLSRLVLAGALASAFLYVDEMIAAALADGVTRAATFNRMFGDYAGLYWAAIFFTVVVPQLLWLPAARVSIVATVYVGLAVSLGIWFDRFSIVVGGLQHTYLPSMRRAYEPTLVETGLLLGTIGLFAALLLAFVRYLPTIAMFEVRHDENEDRT